MATLSRIENNKQSLELNLLVTLARILEIPPAELLVDGDGNGNGNGEGPLARRIASLEPKKRTELWRDLAADSRTQRSRSRPAAHDLGRQVEEVLAQLDLLREELETIRKRIRRNG